MYWLPYNKNLKAFSRKLRNKSFRRSTALATTSCRQHDKIHLQSPEAIESLNRGFLLKDSEPGD